MSEEQISTGASVVREKTDEDEMDEIIERLREEKLNAKENAYWDGNAAGEAWARSAHYHDLCYATERFDPWTEGYMFEATLIWDSCLGDYFRTQLNKPPFELTGDEEHGVVGELEMEWYDGWSSAVREFWKKVSSRLGG